jgi:hypothetical protein
LAELVADFDARTICSRVLRLVPYFFLEWLVVLRDFTGL